MASTSIKVGKFGVDSVGADDALLTVRPDMRILKLSFLAPAIVLIAGIVAYLLPSSIRNEPKYDPFQHEGRGGGRAS